jgi:hypothetical protein
MLLAERFVLPSPIQKSKDYLLFCMGVKFGFSHIGKHVECFPEEGAEESIWI